MTSFGTIQSRKRARQSRPSKRHGRCHRPQQRIEPG